jgi:hypothetical protein
MRRYTIVALTLCLWSAANRPAIAQSSSAFELARISFTSVREYVASEAIATQLSVPANVVIADMYRSLLTRMLQHSPTFRRQSQRIAAEPGLVVHITVEPLRMQSSVRAVTRMTRQPNGSLSAFIVIDLETNVVELIAHEFEHVIEQLDGVDLAALAARSRTGVRQDIGLRGSFETVRAKHVGRKVYAEFWRAL